MDRFPRYIEVNTRYNPVLSGHCYDAYGEQEAPRYAPCVPHNVSREKEKRVI